MERSARRSRSGWDWARNAAQDGAEDGDGLEELANGDGNYVRLGWRDSWDGAATLQRAMFGDYAGKADGRHAARAAASSGAVGRDASGKWKVCSECAAPNLAQSPFCAVCTAEFDDMPGVDGGGGLYDDEDVDDSEEDESFASQDLSTSSRDSAPLLSPVAARMCIRLASTIRRQMLRAALSKWHEAAHNMLGAAVQNGFLDAVHRVELLHTLRIALTCNHERAIRCAFGRLAAHQRRPAQATGRLLSLVVQLKARRQDLRSALSHLRAHVRRHAAVERAAAAFGMRRAKSSLRQSFWAWAGRARLVKLRRCAVRRVAASTRTRQLRHGLESLRSAADTGIWQQRAAAAAALVLWSQSRATRATAAALHALKRNRNVLVAVEAATRRQRSLTARRCFVALSSAVRRGARLQRASAKLMTRTRRGRLERALRAWKEATWAARARLPLVALAITRMIRCQNDRVRQSLAHWARVCSKRAGARDLLKRVGRRWQLRGLGTAFQRLKQHAALQAQALTLLGAHRIAQLLARKAWIARARAFGRLQANEGAQKQREAQLQAGRACLRWRLRRLSRAWVAWRSAAATSAHARKTLTLERAFARLRVGRITDAFGRLKSHAEQTSQARTVLSRVASRWSQRRLSHAWRALVHGCAAFRARSNARQTLHRICARFANKRCAAGFETWRSFVFQDCRLLRRALGAWGRRLADVSRRALWKWRAVASLSAQADQARWQCTRLALRPVLARMASGQVARALNKWRSVARASRSDQLRTRCAQTILRPVLARMFSLPLARAFSRWTRHTNCERLAERAVRALRNSLLSRSWLGWRAFVDRSSRLRVVMLKTPVVQRLAHGFAALKSNATQAAAAELQKEKLLGRVLLHFKRFSLTPVARAWARWARYCAQKQWFAKVGLWASRSGDARRLRFTFRAWASAFERRKAAQNRLRRSAETRLARRAFLAWSDGARARSTLLRWLALLSEKDLQSKVREAFGRLVQAAKDRRASRDVAFALRAALLSWSRKSRALSCLRAFYKLKGGEASNFDEAESTLRSCFSHWRSAVTLEGLEQRELGHRLAEVETTDLARHFFRWQTLARLRRRGTYLANPPKSPTEADEWRPLLEHFGGREALSRAFCALAAGVRICKVERRAGRVSAAMCIANARRRKLRAAFSKWGQHIVFRRVLGRAAGLSSRCTVKGALHAWREHAQDLRQSQVDAAQKECAALREHLLDVLDRDRVARLCSLVQRGVKRQQREALSRLRDHRHISQLVELGQAYQGHLRAAAKQLRLARGAKACAILQQRMSERKASQARLKVGWMALRLRAGSFTRKAAAVARVLNARLCSEATASTLHVALMRWRSTVLLDARRCFSLRHALESRLQRLQRACFAAWATWCRSDARRARLKGFATRWTAQSWFKAVRASVAWGNVLRQARAKGARAISMRVMAVWRAFARRQRLLRRCLRRSTRYRVWRALFALRVNAAEHCAVAVGTKLHLLDVCARRWRARALSCAFRTLELRCNELRATQAAASRSEALATKSWLWRWRRAAQSRSRRRKAVRTVFGRLARRTLGGAVLQWRAFAATKARQRDPQMGRVLQRWLVSAPRKEAFLHWRAAVRESCARTKALQLALARSDVGCKRMALQHWARAARLDAKRRGALWRAARSWEARIVGSGFRAWAAVTARVRERAAALATVIKAWSSRALAHAWRSLVRRQERLAEVGSGARKVQLVLLRWRSRALAQAMSTLGTHSRRAGEAALAQAHRSDLVAATLTERLRAMRRVLSGWKRRLQSSAFRAWKASTDEKRKRDAALSRFARQWRVRLLAQAWRTWRWRIEQFRECKTALRRAASRWRIRCLGRAWTCWQIHVEGGLEHDKLVSRALMRWRSGSLSRSFSAWKECVVERARIREIARRSMSHWTSRSLRSAWAAWRDRAVRSRTLKLCFARVAAQWRRRALASSMRSWAAKTRTCHLRSEALGRTLRWWRLRRLAKAWSRWRTSSIHAEARREARCAFGRIVVQRVVKRLANNVIARAWRTWVAGTQSQLQARSRLSRLLHLWLKVRIREAFTKLRAWRDTSCAAARMSRLCSSWRQRRLAAAFRSWLGASFAQRRTGGALRRFLGRWKARQVSAAFSTWRTCTERQVGAVRAARRVAFMMSNRARMALTRAFGTWKSVAVGTRASGRAPSNAVPASRQVHRILARWKAKRLASAFEALRGHARAGSERAKRVRRTVLRWRLRAAREALWKLARHARRQRQLERAIACASRRQLAAAFGCWVATTHTQSNCHAALRRLVFAWRGRAMLLKQQAFLEWRYWTLTLAARESRLVVAVAAWSLRTVARAFRQWAATARRRRRRRAALVDWAGGRREQALKRALSLWAQSTRNERERCETLRRIAARWRLSAARAGFDELKRHASRAARLSTSLKAMMRSSSLCRDRAARWAFSRWRRVSQVVGRLGRAVGAWRARQLRAAFRALASNAAKHRWADAIGRFRTLCGSDTLATRSVLERHRTSWAFSALKQASVHGRLERALADRRARAIKSVLGRWRRQTVQKAFDSLRHRPELFCAWRSVKRFQNVAAQARADQYSGLALLSNFAAWRQTAVQARLYRALARCLERSWDAVEREGQVRALYRWKLSAREARAASDRTVRSSAIRDLRSIRDEARRHLLDLEVSRRSSHFSFS